MQAEVVSAVDAEIGNDEIATERRRFDTGSESTRGPIWLLPESVRLLDGVGPVVELGSCRGKLLVVTLGLSAVVERTGLTVSVWGSRDEIEWGDKPLISLKQREYCGVYSVLLNLAHRPEIRCLRVEWSISRLGKGERIAQFGFQVFAEESGARISTSACA
jgi:hypothetical protein